MCVGGSYDMDKRMVVDATSLNYVCPFCDLHFVSLQKCQSHVTDSEDDEHYRYNGYTMDATIQVVQSNEHMTIEDKILEAAETIDEPSTKDAKKLQTELDVSRFRIERVWDDAGIDVKYLQSHSPISWERLEDHHAELLAFHYHNKDIPIIHKENHFDVHETTLNNLIRFKGFLLEDKYRPQWVDDYEYDGPEVKEVADDDNMTERTDTAIMMGKDGSFEQWVDMVRAFESSGIEYVVSVEATDSNFEVLKKLIENGYGGLAEELHD